MRKESTSAMVNKLRTIFRIRTSKYERINVEHESWQNDWSTHKSRKRDNETVFVSQTIIININN